MAVKDAGGKQKPKKPYPEFPFYAHRNGQWARKVKGKTHFFGTWDDPDAAMQNYNDDIHEIRQGSAKGKRKREKRKREKREAKGDILLIH